MISLNAEPRSSTIFSQNSSMYRLLSSCLPLRNRHIDTFADVWQWLLVYTTVQLADGQLARLANIRVSSSEVHHKNSLMEIHCNNYCANYCMQTFLSVTIPHITINTWDHMTSPDLTVLVQLLVSVKSTWLSVNVSWYSCCNGNKSWYARLRHW